MENEVFVFAYGSLMWNPQFEVRSMTPAVCRGWRRSWCVRSVHYRGCHRNPGWVLGLTPGGECLGMLIRIGEGRSSDILRQIHARETAEAGYERRIVPVDCGGTIFGAVSYVSPGLEEASDEELDIAYQTAVGIAGRNSDYIDKTLSFLKGLERN